MDSQSGLHDGRDSHFIVLPLQPGDTSDTARAQQPWHGPAKQRKSLAVEICHNHIKSAPIEIFE